MSDIE